MIDEKISKISYKVGKFIKPIGNEYEKCSKQVHHLIMNFIIIYLFMNVRNWKDSNLIQIVISLTLVGHLFMWLCWSLSGLFKDERVKGGKRR